jgi:hypothetical protein
MNTHVLITNYHIIAVEWKGMRGIKAVKNTLNLVGL